MKIKKDRDAKKERIENRLNEYRKELGKSSIKDLSNEEVKNFIKEKYKSENRFGFYNQISILNELLAEKRSKVVIDSKALVNECVIADDSKYFLKDEVLDICNKLTNTQDKFIIYALFNGIMGKNCEDLLSIKTTDVSKDCSYIKVNGQIYFLDDILKEYVKDLLKNEDYIREVTGLNTEYTERFNTSSPYLIKTIPNKRTNDGLDKMTRNNLNGRLQKLNKLLLEKGYDVKLVPRSLYFSGIMFKMFEKEIDENIEWSIEKLDDWLKMNDYSTNAIELYRKYYNKYHGVNSSKEIELNFNNNNKIKKIINDDIKGRILEELTKELANKEFYVKNPSSIGSCNEIAWIMNKKITDNTQKGIYIVLLADIEGKGFYLSLNQSFTFIKKFCDKNGGDIEKTLEIASDFLRNNIDNIPNESLKNIDLKEKKEFTRYYEISNIIAKYYSLEEKISDDQIIGDIKSYISIYESLIKKLNINAENLDEFYNNILYKAYKKEGFEFDLENEKIRLDELLKEPFQEIKKTKERKSRPAYILDSNGKKIYPRDPQVKANALIIAEFKCEANENHMFFTRKSNNQNYTEGHHLIPLQYGIEFEYSIDVEENIVSLCPVCHSKLHHAKDEEKLDLLNKLFDERKDKLKEIGLEIDFETLKKYYKINI